jgi:hypothetical protein
VAPTLDAAGRPATPEFFTENTMKKVAVLCAVALVVPLLFLSTSLGVQKEFKQAKDLKPGAAPHKAVFKVENIRIERTWALLRDTVHVSLTVKVGAKKFGPFHKHLGDHGDGTVQVNLATPPIPFNPKDKVSFNYVVLNSGHKSQEKVEQAVTKGIDELLGLFFDNPDGKADWRKNPLTALVNAGLNIIFANCDGVCAADQRVLTGEALIRLGRTHRETRFSPGYDSAVGCGANSKYNVTWSITQ